MIFLKEYDVSSNIRDPQYKSALGLVFQVEKYDGKTTTIDYNGLQGKKQQSQRYNNGVC